MQRGVQIWRSEGRRRCRRVYGVLCRVPDLPRAVGMVFGEIASYQTTKLEAISLAKELNDMNALALALYAAAINASLERNPAEVERFAAELIELSTRYTFAF